MAESKLHFSHKGLVSHDGDDDDASVPSFVVQAGKPFSLSCMAAYTQTEWKSTAEGFTNEVTSTEHAEKEKSSESLASDPNSQSLSRGNNDASNEVSDAACEFIESESLFCSRLHVKSATGLVRLNALQGRSTYIVKEGRLQKFSHNSCALQNNMGNRVLRQDAGFYTCGYGDHHLKGKNLDDEVREEEEEEMGASNITVYIYVDGEKRLRSSLILGKS